MDWIPVVTKVYKFLSERERKAETNEVRKWIQPLLKDIKDIDALLSIEELDRLVRDALPEGPWQSAVAFSQTLLLVDSLENLDEVKKRLEMLLNVWNEKSVNYSALLTELRKRVLSLGKPEASIIETLDYDPNKPSYFSSDYSESGVDFFLNYLRFEEGVDVDGLVEPLKKLLEKDQNVEEFLRLCGIDELVQAGEFLERVERAVDVFVKAKEQGLDLEEILRKWDELANGGGSRFGYLEEAVKAVADEEVGRKFWEEVERVLGEKDIPVISLGYHEDRETPRVMISLGLASFDGGKVTLSEEFLKGLESAFEVVKKLNPSAIYSMGDILKVIREVGLEKVSSAKEFQLRLEILAKLSPSSLRFIFSDPKILDAYREAVRKTVLRGFDENRFVEALEETIREGPSVSGFLGRVLENVHKEEGA